MKQITGEEFREIIFKDPSWCLKLNEPVEITTHITLMNSQITHLSPWLHFKGKNEWGWSAIFNSSIKLTVAAGTYEGAVSFDQCPIKQTDGLLIKGYTKDGRSANFSSAEFKDPEGEFKGFVVLQNCLLLDDLTKITVHKGATKVSINPPEKTKISIENCPKIKPNIELLRKIYHIDDKLKDKILMDLVRKSLKRIPTI